MNQGKFTREHAIVQAVKVSGLAGKFLSVHSTFYLGYFHFSESFCFFAG